MALDYIATKNKIKADKESIDKTVASTPNGQQRRMFIEYVLTQQKTIEFLQSHNI